MQIDHNDVKCAARWGDSWFQGKIILLKWKNLLKFTHNATLFGQFKTKGLPFQIPV